MIDGDLLSYKACALVRPAPRKSVQVECWIWIVSGLYQDLATLGSQGRLECLVDVIQAKLVRHKRSSVDLSVSYKIQRPRELARRETLGSFDRKTFQHDAIEYYFNWIKAYRFTRPGSCAQL